MTKTIKAAATDSIVYTSLNDAKDMPKQKMVMAMVAGINGFCDCFRTIDPEQGGKEIFWLEEECREVDESEIIGWVNYPQYEAE
ncbi:MAG: hypothetical protein H6937_02320 [Burkholderiales bacterium]|nr:hypothetical protein [Burkholderiales bacterium]